MWVHLLLPDTTKRKEGKNEWDYTVAEQDIPDFFYHTFEQISSNEFALLEHNEAAIETF